MDSVNKNIQSLLQVCSLNKSFDLKNCTHEQAWARAKACEQSRNVKEAMQIYLFLTDEGNVHAHTRIKELIEGGSDRISADAFTVFHGAAKYNNSKFAPQFLGIMYENGYGVDENKDKAFEYYLLAKFNEVPEANYSIAAMYEEGSANLPKDLIKALHHYELAYKQSVPGAAFRIASIYNEGELPSGQNMNEALKWYIKGSDQEDLDAQDALLGMSMDGRLKHADALDIIEAAADAGDRRAIEKLTTMRPPL